MNSRYALAIVAVLFGADASAQGVPDPDPELERKTFIVPEGLDRNLNGGSGRPALPRKASGVGRGRWTRRLTSSFIVPALNKSTVVGPIRT